MAEMIRLIPAAAALLVLGACDPARLYGAADEQAALTWAAFQGYQAEVWDRRRALREKCDRDVIDPGVERLVDRGRGGDAIAVIEANYPGLVLPTAIADFIDDDFRRNLRELLADMPSCAWPEGIEYPAAAAP